MAGNIVKEFTEIDLEFGNTQNVLEENNEISISVLSAHINLDTASKLFGTEKIKIGNQEICCPIAIINKKDVILITPDEAKLYKAKTPLIDILSKR